MLIYKSLKYKGKKSVETEYIVLLKQCFGQKSHCISCNFIIMSHNFKDRLILCPNKNLISRRQFWGDLMFPYKHKSVFVRMQNSHI